MDVRTTNMEEKHLRLGVNIDHVATVRNARGGEHPDPLQAAQIAVRAGADGITAHLREDRRHIKDDDILRIVENIKIPLNLEMAGTEEMLIKAIDYAPHAVCIVPEKRDEKTTEGGLNVFSAKNKIKDMVSGLSDKGIRVSLFVEPETIQIEAAKESGAPVIELHTGNYCNTIGDNQLKELLKIQEASDLAVKLGLEVHAGHGLGYESVGPIANILQISELNIGHFLIGQAIFDGLQSSIQKMRFLMNEARSFAVD